MPPRGRGRTRGGGQSGSEEHPEFTANLPEQETGFDDVEETKFGKRQEKLSKIGFGFGPSMGFADDLLDSDLAMLDVSSFSKHAFALGQTFYVIAHVCLPSSCRRCLTARTR